MSDNKPTPLTAEELKAIAGGCTITELQDALARLRESYDQLVDFTSYVIERVAE